MRVDLLLNVRRATIASILVTVVLVHETVAQTRTGAPPSLPRHLPEMSAPASNAQTAVAVAATRRWLPPLSLVRTIVGPDHDELLMPGSLVATSNGHIALFDFGTMELRAFSVEGRPLWRAGRKGAGPGEFRNAMDVKLARNGDLAVLDMGNRRITTVSSSGHVLRTTPLRFSSSRFMPFGDTTAVAVTSEDSGSLWTAVNWQGTIVRRGKAPPFIAVQPAIVREMFTASFGTGTVATFRWSSKFLLLDANGDRVRVIEGIEPLPFPAIKSYPMKMGKFTGQVSRIAPRAVPGALSVATHSDRIFILFAGASANRGRIIDVYSATTGAYVGSELLGIAAQELVILPDGALATLRVEPLPAIDIWRSGPREAGVRGAVREAGAQLKNAGVKRSRR